MATVAYRHVELSAAESPERRILAAERAYWILYAGFIVAPIVAGLDKFTHVLVNWDQYFSPFFAGLIGSIAPHFMKIVGVVEIVTGIAVAVAPRFGGYLVSGASSSICSPFRATTTSLCETSGFRSVRLLSHSSLTFAIAERVRR